MRKAKLTILILLLFSGISLFAQDTLDVNGKQYQFLKGATDTIKSNGNSFIIKYVTEPSEADLMRSNGKIYVVVLVLAAIFAGLIAYLVRLDMKITRLEKSNNS